ncbi:hypothetical protein ACO0K9_01125 [Undibacterium sp. Ji50W]|uniref:hypothetical protein n=1 Tax=Undibacterium sp. Ji50W TaxID=3413041 RepID=UPI003BF32271
MKKWILHHLKWWIAGKELEELHRWRTFCSQADRWLAEFPNVVTALDYVRTEANGTRGNDIMRMREKMREIATPQLSKFDEGCLKTGQQMQRAAGELPDGYEVVIYLENGAGTVHLLDKYSDAIQLDDGHDDIASEIEAAIEIAKEHAEMKAKP